MANHYEIPSWAGKPAPGLHLDVLKGDKLIQKLMIDEKKCYLFGRNPQLNDFCIDHASCSRVHAAVVFHKHLGRAFLVDLGSTHGTYIGSIKLESQKPTQLPTDSTFHFGASTRMYILRERPSMPKPGGHDNSDKLGAETDQIEGGLLGLPETEGELDNLTEFNTAHNRRISMLGIPDDETKAVSTRKRKGRNVGFNEDEEVINPEDIDPSVGRFRNLVQTAVVPIKVSLKLSFLIIISTDDSKKMKTDSDLNLSKTNHRMHGLATFSSAPSLYGDLPDPGIYHEPQISPSIFSSTLSNKLGISFPNPAPQVEITEPNVNTSQVPTVPLEAIVSQEPKKKKYAKEAWPGKKPTISNLLV
ncbi:Nuclear inhibitor of protein phosphatase 1 [Nymphon striatum]|nr:Nuclear inhibitor of protein phosphatase 1 [Nymphon striatum]